ncbi:stage V sporulation protein B [Desulfohalotomaculum tongense]|uniref:stage V sporulation protein B n=1 Tax=Desulforadius tongensis TaxID=1216062 RepID=UPI00195B52C8|nr:stage V sporulation protein B [Desulforadius tongensis]MBM7855279.1 stage V sporulation protein B [Desulforadius tongensis]
MKKQSFIYGALVLLIASIFNRAVGFAYQIIVIRLIKPEGVGLFNMVYPVYVMVMVLSTMGIPLAISKLVAEEIASNNTRGAYRIFYICLILLILSGTLFTLGLFFAAPLLVKYYFPNPKVYYSFLALIPGIFIVSLCSAFRGFFQGLQQMTPTAVTQVIEQLVRVTAGLTIAYFLLPRGVEYAAIGISLGVVCGEITGFLTMLFIYLRSRPLAPGFSGSFETLGTSLQRIFSLGIPVTLTRFVSTALMSIDAVLIPHRLQAGGLTLQQATALYGQFVGIAQTLLLTPGVITAALATALIPAVSDALAQNNIKLVQSRTSEAIRLTNIAAFPCIVLFLFIPEELCRLLFGYQEAGQSLAIMALGGLFLYFSQTTTGILQGMGEAIRPFKNLVIASSFKIAGIYFLTANADLGIKGTSMAIVLYCVIMAGLNYIDLKKLTGFRMYFVVSVIKPFFSAVLMGITVWFVNNNMFAINNSPALSTLTSIFLGISVYVLSLIIMGGVPPQDIARVKKFFQKALSR